MNKVRVKLLRMLAGNDSVMLNTTVNLYKEGMAEKPISVVYRGKTYQTTQGTPVIEVNKGALISGCTFRQMSGSADRIMNGE